MPIIVFFHPARFLARQHQDTDEVSFTISEPCSDVRTFIVSDFKLGDLKIDLLEDRFNVNESELIGLTLKYEFESFTFTSATALYNNDREVAQRFPLNLGSEILPLLGLPPVDDGAEELGWTNLEAP